MPWGHGAGWARDGDGRNSANTNRSGDSMKVSALLTFYDEQGNQVDVEGNLSTKGIPFEINGARNPLEAGGIAKHRSTPAHPSSSHRGQSAAR